MVFECIARSMEVAMQESPWTFCALLPSPLLCRYTNYELISYLDSKNALNLSIPDISAEKSLISPHCDEVLFPVEFEGYQSLMVVVV